MKSFQKEFAQFWFLILSLSVLLLSGCVGQNLYHGGNSAWENHPEANYSLNFIEIDEAGELYQPEQLQRALQFLKEQKEPVLLLTFIHGWKHIGSPEDGNLASFRALLAELGPVMKARGFGVVGVFMSWQGNTVDVWPPVPVADIPAWAAQQTTFWSRKRAAKRAAGTSSTEVVYSLSQAAKRIPHSKVVLVGHSFGALLLEGAVSQALEGSLLSESEDTQDAPSVAVPADLVLLVNSASESIYAKQFIDMLRRQPQPSPGDVDYYGPNRPLVVSVTSTGDTATGFWFPLGASLGDMFKRFRTYDDGPYKSVSQRYFFTHTPGHNRYLQTHTVEKAVNAAGEPIKGTPSSLCFAYNLTNETGLFFTVKDGTRYSIKPVTPNPTAYWVVQVPTDIIRDHDDIFNTNFMPMVGTLFRLSRAAEMQEGKILISK
jgi:hypothetical protein